MKRAIPFILLMHNHAAFGDDYDSYWSRWHSEAKMVAECAQIESTAGFMRAALENLGNAERSEANAEALENLALAKPECFVSAVSSLESDRCKNVLFYFVDGAIFNSTETVKTALIRGGLSQATCGVANHSLKADAPDGARP